MVRALAPEGILPCLKRVALDKGEGFVKDRDILSGVCDTACEPEKGEDQDPGNLTLNHPAVGGSCYLGKSRSTNHRYDLNRGHDSSMRTSSRRAGAEVENSFIVFQGA